MKFRSVAFCGRRKTDEPGEARTKTNNKHNPHMTSGPGIELGPD